MHGSYRDGVGNHSFDPNNLYLPTRSCEFKQPTPVGGGLGREAAVRCIFSNRIRGGKRTPAERRARAINQCRGQGTGRNQTL